MTTLKVRFRLNPGRKGIALGKFSKQTENIEMFLRSLASDLGADDGKNMWFASDFRNSSVINTNEFQAVVAVDTAHQFNTAIQSLTKYQGDLKDKPPSYVSSSTIERFSNLRQYLDADETLGVGVFDLDTGKPKRFNYVDKLQLEAIGQSIETEVRYIGAVMGHTHEWNKGAEKPYLIIRELNSSDLVKCSYKDDDYEEVAKLFAKKASIVIIEGSMIFNLITNKTEVVQATYFSIAPEFSEEDFNSFFGMSPKMTGNLSAAEFIVQGRDDE